MNGTACDACLTGYRPGQLIQCSTCKGEFCSSCQNNHGCHEVDLG